MRAGATRVQAHDFRVDGARTIAKLRWLGCALWLEESASWHTSGSATYGLALYRSARWRSIELAAGRYSVHAAWERR